MEYVKKSHFIIITLIALVICWYSWPTVADFTANEIQPIASAVSTISGILFGFVMASISLFASAKDNTLIRNTTLTGHLPKLVSRLHITMGLLLLVCIVFLVVLFLPDTLNFSIGNNQSTYRFSSVLVIVGIFLLIISSRFRIISAIGN